MIALLGKREIRPTAFSFLRRWLSGWKNSEVILSHTTNQLHFDKQLLHDVTLDRNIITWDQALFIYLFFLLLCFFGSRGTPDTVYWTSHQPPPNLHNLTSAWPISQSAFTRRESNFGGNNVPLEINFREKKMFKYVQMALPNKKIYYYYFFYLWWNTASWSCRTFI